MSRGFPADTRSQKVLEEVYEKETISQLNWFLKCQEAKKLHGSEPLTATVINDTPLPDISNILSKSNKQQIEKDKEEIEQSKQTDSSEKKETQEETAEKTFDVGPDMIPPSPDVLKLLYEGISTEGKGRYRYLRDRCKLNVEDRFQYPILSSMEYGWGHAQQ
ncbi:unnamed protein product [Schistosoma turkestanicum]|nr:unnamed protein product [Schistosoma turkestanicum]